MIGTVIVADSRSRADLGRVAVLSDDGGFLRLMREFFSETGFEPVTHLDQHGPVCFVARTRPDVVLLDILVPREKYGWATLVALREHPDTCRTPVIVCAPADWVLDTHRELLDKEGVRRWDSPYDFGDLIGAIQSVGPVRRPDGLSSQESCGQHDALDRVRLRPQGECGLPSGLCWAQLH
jgi:CheY-like chemotaxis protein